MSTRVQGCPVANNDVNAVAGPFNPTAEPDSRVFQLNTIRYRINEKMFALQFFPGMASNIGVNNQTSSAHPSGINAVLADGSVQFLSESMDLSTFKRMATRDDGSPKQAVLVN